jgi:molecular chaperone HscB
MRRELYGVMPADQAEFRKNYFALFSLPEAFRLDAIQLNQQYHALQAQVHPDKFAHLPESEQRASMQWATLVNEAYQTLNDPVSRARYLLSLQGVATQEETNTKMPMDFLMAQMEWREAIEEARLAGDTTQLEALTVRLKHETRALHEWLSVKIDDEHNYAHAAEGVRKLKFLEKLADEIDSAFDLMDT